MPLISCRATINLVGAKAGEILRVDPDDPTTAVHMEKGYLVAVDAVDEPVAESGGEACGEGDADETLDAGAAVGDDADETLEPVSDSVDELAPPAA